MNFEYKVADTPGKWYAEVRIPTHLLGGIREGDCWKINILRSSVGNNGRMQNAVLSKGYFHDLATAPVFTFGQNGPLLLNGDFKFSEKAVIPKPPKNKPDYLWKFENGLMPASWNFHSGNPGIAGLRKEKDGKIYLHLEKGKSNYPMLWQVLRPTGGEVTEYFISFRARGKASFEVNLFHDSNKQCFSRNTFWAKKDWKDFSCTVNMAKAKGIKSIFLKSNNGSVDFSDLRVVAVIQAENPDALKH